MFSTWELQTQPATWLAFKLLYKCKALEAWRETKERWAIHRRSFKGDKTVAHENNKKWRGEQCTSEWMLRIARIKWGACRSKIYGQEWLRDERIARSRRKHPPSNFAFPALPRRESFSKLSKNKIKDFRKLFPKLFSGVQKLLCFHINQGTIIHYTLLHSLHCFYSVQGRSVTLNRHWNVSK